MPANPNQSRAGDAAPAEAATVLDRMLGTPDQSGVGSLADGEVATWAETHGTLADGRAVRLGASCLLRPTPGDRVLIWSGEDGKRWILNVLERGQEGPSVVATTGPLTIKAPRVALTAEAVHIHAEDFLTSARNRHAVEHLRTESVQTRVAQIGTDIRRASHASDEVEGTVLQRAGTWISNTLREARLHAKAFLFD
ncbi:MAG: DUF3540 domain-containing protein [Gammaproteobacteria bacterium]|nr:DUF3540 domain-containing protein [Gammaproteobacteria bacterium]